MKLPRRNFLHLAAGAAALPVMPCLAWAQAYPTRPVHWIVGLRTSGPATMKPSALRIERLLTKVEAELACSARTRRYVFHFDEIEAAEAQGLPYVLVPRVLSNREWMEKYGRQPVSRGDSRKRAGRRHHEKTRAPG